VKATIYQITWKQYVKNTNLLGDVLDQFKEELKEETAVKTHFGEPGNNNALRGEIIKPAIDWMAANKIKGFLTDTNTLYIGKRSVTRDHLETAKKHGFTEMGLPVVISEDDDHEFTLTDLPNHYKELPIRLGRELREASSILCLSHVKGHVSFGYGGALKNLGMGGASPKGKRVLHAKIIPEVILEKCIQCQTCVRNCPGKAISLVNDKITINHERCIGCGECATVCPQSAIEISEKDSTMCQEKTAVYAYGLVKDKPLVCVNYLININKVCDCAAYTEERLMDNLGILVSTDPVAIDQASLDWINTEAGRNLFKEVNGDDGVAILKMGEEIGLGSRKYTLKKV
jgi:uncharacterized Fe-S center protein